MRKTLAAALCAALLSCGPGTKPPVDVPPNHGNGAGNGGPVIELPNVPATVATERRAPTDGHDPSARSPMLDLMAAENARWIAELSRRDQLPAYYIAYQVADRKTISIAAEGGSLLNDDEDLGRELDVEVRVGRPEFDNRAPYKDDPLGFLAGLKRVQRIPFGTDDKAVRHHLWLATDREYRRSAEQLARVLTNTRVARDAGERPPDFVHMPKAQFIQPVAQLEVDRAAWTARMRECSERATRGVATRSTCTVDFAVTTVYYVNSEGTELQLSYTSAHLAVSVGVKADDGMPLSRTEIVFARDAAGLPTDEELEGMIGRVNQELSALHAAPIVDPYVGPAILRGRAAGVFFHEVFGHRIEAHRQKDETGGQTFSSKIGQRIMPEWLTVYDDPTVVTLNGEFLNGFYRFDDEGVAGQRALLVEDGVLRGFVQGRQPIDGFPTSNGHGRHELGLPAVSRQGNLIVEASRSVPDDELKKMLIDEIVRQGKPYGMMFTDISGGFTLTSRFAPQSFKVEPTLAYRVYPDGREELVRGVDIEGTPLTALGSIIAAGRTVEVFNGMCGAESGWVPVSASAPSLLLRSVEVARGFTGSGSSPNLPPP